MKTDDLGNRLMNRIWKSVSPEIRELESFASDLSPDYPEQYQGRAAEIFFSNKAETIHKWLHYLPIYDKLFSPYVGGKPVRFLEIGVFRGGSQRMWREFFGSEAVIYGVDINEDCRKYDGRHGKVRIGSQADAEFLKGVVAEMGGVDIVLDDGSHIASHQRISFDCLFPLLSEGGLYVIEDLHTSYWPHAEGGLRRRGSGIEFLKAKIDDMHGHYFGKNANAADAIPEIESIQFFDSIAALAKRRQLPRHHVMTPRA